ncbi:MAG: hypothetical protein LBL86_07270 [Coriobacteriales bacterium]|jgi:hypothetical protein|nr:hypothetical protein [Coriobacteriales bacterium]
MRATREATEGALALPGVTAGPGTWRPPAWWTDRMARQIADALRTEEGRAEYEAWRAGRDGGRVP